MPRSRDSGGYGCLNILIGYLFLAAALIPIVAFQVGATVLIGRLVGEAGEASHLLTVPVAVALTAGSFLVLDLMVRGMGRKRLARTLLVKRAWQLDPDYQPYGPTGQPAGGGVMEVAFLPVLTLIPVIIVGWEGDPESLLTGGMVVVGLAVTVLPLFTGMLGRVGLCLGAVALAWLPWAVLVTAGRPLLGSLAGLLFGAVGWVLTGRVARSLYRPPKGN